jgi:NAD(P)-dependent dehydrogenase (short-subunit alcohol dehydrogenase family)
VNKEWVLVTGSSKGLGFEIAKAFAQAGWRPVLTGRNSDALDAAAKKINSMADIECTAVCLDLTEEGAAVQLHEQLQSRGISLSLIVNNLGGGVPGDRRNIPQNILRASLRLNLEAGVEINNEFYDDIKANKGVIIHIGSMASLDFDAPPGYVISKAAVNAYVKNAARMFAKDGVCIFAVLPGVLEHEGSYISRKFQTDKERYNAFLAQTTFGRFASSAETARFIVKMIEAKTPMMNGAIIQFDGGKS